MNEEILKLIQFIIPASIIVGALILGFIFEKFILTRIRKIAKRTRWSYDEIIIGSLRGVSILWFVLAGIYVAILRTSIRPDILNILQKILLVIIIISGTIVLARLASGFVNVYSKKTEGLLPQSSIFVNITRILVFVIGILIILQSLGVSITPLITALGIGGLAVALALQDTLSNLFSGLQILISRQVKPGDYIQLETGQEGYVTDVTWRNTTIRALPNNMVIVPNSKLASTIVINYNQPAREMSVIVQVGVSYDSDLAKVERVTIDIAKEVMEEVHGGVSEFTPFIRYHTFDDFSINFSVIMRVREFLDKYILKHEFIKKLHKKYNEEGIEIPFPIRTIHMNKKKE
ncbi:mechanosensitive ion channel [candidate division WOR-3 bacterium]|nr:mechanosensitive ion channel [candidate division WOR-3 bacterium]